MLVLVCTPILKAKSIYIFFLLVMKTRLFYSIIKCYIVNNTLLNKQNIITNLKECVVSVFSLLIFTSS